MSAGKPHSQVERPCLQCKDKLLFSQSHVNPGKIWMIFVEPSLLVTISNNIQQLRASLCLCSISDLPFSPYLTVLLFSKCSQLLDIFFPSRLLLLPLRAGCAATHE